MAPLSNRPADALILQYLGAAVMLCWGRLPLGARELILHQADDVIGLAPVAQTRNEVVKLLLRNAKMQWVASLSSARKP
jgi:hypothetical protein